MTDKTLDDLKAIVDRLGPNMWLGLDPVAFARFFGIQLERGHTGPAREAALAFAQQNGLTMMFNSNKVEFARAYTKRDDDI
jgi:hypothetical protein